MAPWRQLFLALLVALCGSAMAIDNPDAPDRVGAFNGRAAPFEQGLAATDGGGAAVQAGAAYAKFLDGELNRTYTELLPRLEPEARRALVASQRQWLRFRTAELAFMRQQWTRERNGSSSALSLADYSNRLVKERVLLLLSYMSEYADPPR